MISGLPYRIPMGSGVLHLYPITVRQAVEALSASSAITETADRAMVLELVKSWPWQNPGKAMTLLRTKLPSDPADLRVCLRELVAAGSELRRFLSELGTASETGSGADIGDIGFWQDLLRAYCACWRCDPWTVYNTTPFPFFLAMAKQAQRQQALDSMAMATAVGVGFGGDKNGRLWSRWQKQARTGTKPKTMPELMTEKLDPDQLRTEREALRETILKQS